MTVKRTPGPHRKAPGRVRIALDGAEGDERAVVDLLRSLAPAARVERLKRHPEMVAEADELAAVLTGGAAPREREARDEFFRRLAHAEQHAERLDVAGDVERAAASNANLAPRRPAVSDDDVRRVIADPACPTRKLQALQLGITVRALQKRLAAMR